MLPLSIRREFLRLESRITTLKIPQTGYLNEEKLEDLKIEIHEIIQAISHIGDKAANYFWHTLNDGKNKKKPNVYFPCCDTEERFSTRMQALQLDGAKDAYPKIYEAFQKAQPFSNKSNSWLKFLKDLANLKHERSPNIDQKIGETGTGIGRGQNLYIEHLSISNGQIVRGKMRAWNQETGAEENPRIEIIQDIKKILESTETNPIEFAEQCLTSMKSIVITIYGL